VRTLKFGIEEKGFIIPLDFEYRIGLPLGATELGSMVMQTHGPWKQQVEKGLWMPIDQGIQTVIPDLFHVAFLQYIVFYSVYQMDCCMSILRYNYTVHHFYDTSLFYGIVYEPTLDRWEPDMKTRRKQL